MPSFAVFAALVAAATLALLQPIAGQLLIDRTSPGRAFDGIGGLSGGGATSRLLVDYKVRSVRVRCV